ncbi:hypothetical protein NLI96_g9017 [Meripilus lineatus]|uniref:Major facilitator superfamily (MFS) profile domain-containing protein n=1 Tax=Meripilus lineatus TaxID=2056292 RepID=A0AAD5YBF9_9APHY|nr:hypothetical protein NLI96_g9017 [Physisporinus lineatus]
MLDKVAEHTKLERAEAFYDDVTINEEDAQVKEKTSSLKSEKQQVIESEGAVTPEEDPYSPENLNVPDGGLRAWLVVLGAACGTFATFGYVNAWGVFQAYYQETLLKDTPPSTIAWIGSIEYALIFIPGLVAGRIFDMGLFRIPLLLASIAVVAATFLIAECKEYWQFLLCQGFAVGLSCGVIFGPMLGVNAHWFKKKRGLALGLVALGSSIGGTLFPIAARNLIAAVGFPWTMRILGFIQLAALAVTNLTLRARLPPKPSPGPFVDLSAFKNPAYTIWCLSGFVSFLGLYTVLTYIDVSATHAGISNDFSFYLVSIANAGSGVGRIGGGIIADRIGAVNVMIPSTLIAAILTFAWPFATTKGSLVAVAIIYGIASGVYVSLLAAPLMQMGDTRDVGLRVGMSMTVLAFGAVAGPPISGAINQSTDGFQAVGYYAGSTVILSVIMMIIVRQLMLRRWWGKF